MFKNRKKIKTNSIGNKTNDYLIIVINIFPTFFFLFKIIYFNVYTSSNILKLKYFYKNKVESILNIKLLVIVEYHEIILINVSRSF
jgi:hypothetical protein